MCFPCYLHLYKLIESYAIVTAYYFKKSHYFTPMLLSSQIR